MTDAPEEPTASVAPGQNRRLRARVIRVAEDPLPAPHPRPGRPSRAGGDPGSRTAGPSLGDRWRRSLQRGERRPKPAGSPSAEPVPGGIAPAARPPAPSRPARSLAARLGRAVLGAVIVALAAAAALGAWSEVGRYAADTRRALTGLASVFAAAAAGAAAADDAAGAHAALRAIARQDGIVYAGLTRPDGTALAEQGTGLRLADDLDLDEEGLTPLALVLARTVKVSVPVVENARVVGRVTLIADTADLVGRLVDVVRNALMAAGLAMAVGFAVAWRLGRALTRPLTALARTMDAVRENHDYARRAVLPPGAESGDEVGRLATSFNGLIDAVRERDHRLVEHQARLEQEVSDRTHDLSEAKEAAEAANSAKSSFLATMSHEIRTPMNGMLVMAELLAAAELPARQRRYAEVIARSGQSLLAIINDILDFAKVEAGKLTLERIALDPSEVADTVVTLFGERARAKGLDLAAVVGPDVPRAVHGDPVRLGQVLGNFVNNALKFTESGHVLVRLDTRDRGETLRLSVSDTGIGIPAETLPTIFSAFSQADGSTTRRFGGTGLGLSIAERLVAAMGGRIGVESEVGRGSTFWAEIPLDVLAAAEPVLRQGGIVPAVAVAISGSATRLALTEGLLAAGFAPGETGQGAHHFVEAFDLARIGRRPAGAGRVVAIAPMGEPSGAAVLSSGLADALLRWPLAQGEWRPALAALATGKTFAGIGAEAGPVVALPRFPAARVLVADDNPVNREVAVEALGRLGVTRVVTVEDGFRALDVAREGGFDLILMDGSMPGLDGFDAARAIRQWEAAQGAARIPIVASTAHVVGTAAEAWREAGMDGVLAKPFTLADLARTLAAALGTGGEAGTIGGIEGARGTDAPMPAALLEPDTLAGLAEMAEGSGSAFVGRVLGLFAAHGPDGLATLRAAADAEAAGRAAHGLKSMSLNVGAAALAGHLREIEHAARVEGRVPDEATLAPLDGLLTASIAALYGHFGMDTPAPALRDAA
ncbi:hybrid sensor histidine kinase/response regulator [Methylobacterium frigidaeris]|nr:hybrid sensor histidine kinase/response regulator [Methylobacterium frigidaeris]PIK69133.1 hybrid sensor histidine kinase/response regulator [Methylobacterium frigidaeris]